MQHLHTNTQNQLQRILHISCKSNGATLWLNATNLLYEEVTEKYFRCCCRSEHEAVQLQSSIGLYEQGRGCRCLTSPQSSEAGS